MNKDRADFALFLREYGLCRNAVDAVAMSNGDLVPSPDDPVFSVRPSPIHGQGLFTEHALFAGTLLAARIGGKRTAAGRYSNHSPTPNTQMMGLTSGDLLLVALRDIAADEEITLDYRQALATNMELLSMLHHLREGKARCPLV